MAGLGRKQFQANEVLTAADVNGYLMDQSVMVFDDATARDAAITSPTEGMLAYLKDTDEILKYTTTWESISNPGDITAVTAGTALTGGGTTGDVTLNVDLTAVQPNVITTQGDLVIGDSSGDATRLPVGAANTVLTSNGTTVSFQAAGGGGFDSMDIITSSNSSYSIPSLGSDIIKVTVVGGGGGGAGADFNGLDGGDSSVAGSGLTTVTASGGMGGAAPLTNSRVNVTGAFVSYNGGNGEYDAEDGGGGEIKEAYLDVSGLSTLNITIGSGGLRNGSGKNGFKGEVRLEYVSA